MKLLKILLTAVIWTLIIYISIGIVNNQFINPFNFTTSDFKLLLFGGWGVGCGLGMYLYLDD